MKNQCQKMPDAPLREGPKHCHPPDKKKHLSSHNTLAMVSSKDISDAQGKRVKKSTAQAYWLNSHQLFHLDCNISITSKDASRPNNNRANNI